MDKTPIICFVFVLILISLTLNFVHKYVDDFKNLDISIFAQSWNKIKSSKVFTTDESLIKFSSDVVYDSVYQDVVLTNPDVYKCIPEYPRLCDVNDASTCFGCQNLIARCIHFDEDVTFKKSDTSIGILKKNSSTNEGYCLSLDKITTVCNQYHGKLGLVSSVDQTLQKDVYSLLCLCTNPGYIGNNHITDACNTPFVCNGKVKNINIELNKIECECEESFYSKTLNNTPSCQEYQLLNTPKDVKLSHTIAIDKNLLNSNISGNYQFDSITSPCAYCPVTGVYTGGKIVENGDNVQCVNSDPSFGVPIRRNKSWRLLKGTEGPDAILAIRNFKVAVYGYVEDSIYPTLGIIFKKLDNPKFFNDSETEQTLKIEPWNQCKFPGNFNLPEFNTAPNIQLLTYGFTYDDYFQNPASNKGFDSNFLATGLYLNTFIDSNILIYNQEELPSKYLWKRESWQVCQKEMKPMIKIKKINNLEIVMHNQNLLSLSEEAKAIKFVYMIYDLPNKSYASYSALTDEGYNKVRDMLISKGD